MHIVKTFIGLICVLFPLFLFSQDGYLEISNVEKRIDQLTKQYPGLCTKVVLSKSFSGIPIHVLKIGKGDENMKPGIVLVSGVDGNHLSGVWATFGILENILSSKDEIWMRFLEENMLYVIPVINVDAYDQSFKKPISERRLNLRPTDQDKDGRTDEDPYEDLNKDGYITMFRVKDPSGKMVIDTTYNFLMQDWDKKVQTTERFHMYSEGIDNDRDGKFNEDGIGGVDINSNFAFNYPTFAGDAGAHALSENESRVVADYLFDRFNIYAVFTFGLENTLSEPIKFDKQKTSKRIITGPYEEDGTVNELVSDMFNKSGAIADAISMAPKAGSFSQWAYFHYGRLSYSSPIWLAPILKVAESEDAEKDKKPKSKKEPNKDSYDHRYVKWADSMQIKDYFVPWKPFDHPDFPNETVEIGGFKPFMRHNPPTQFLDSSIIKHTEFLKTFVSSMPKLAFSQVKVESFGNQVYRITGKVVNTGLLPTHTVVGDKTRWVRKIRNRAILDKNQEVLINRQRTFHDALKSGDSFEFSWLIKGKGKVTLEVGSPMTGLITHSVELK
jgi:hypothetical protein